MQYGHKTFDTGEKSPETGLPILRHEPLTIEEARVLFEAAAAAQASRAERMPDEQSAIRAMFDAWARLKELGWKDACYCPKDGTHFQVIESGSTGIFDCVYSGEWPTGHWMTFDGGDCYPSSTPPTLFKRYAAPAPNAPAADRP
jgi:hypothetical protein